MVEDLARKSPARRRWLELIAGRVFSTTGFLNRQRGFAFHSRGFRSFGVAHAAQHIRLDEHKFRN